MAPVGDILRKHDIKFHMYAEDIQIFLDFVPTIPGEAACCLLKLSSCISDVQKWILRNKLKLNEDKIEFFIASSPHHKQYLQNVTLHVNDTSIKSVPTVRNFGVIFNDTMTMSQHVSTVCRSVNYHIRSIGKIRKYIDYDTCHAAARALVLSRLDYCNSLLNCITQKDLIRLQKLQNNAARLIHLKPKRSHSSPLLDELHWLPVHQRIIYKTALIMYKTVSNISPYYLSKSLDLSEPKRKGLCSQHNLNIPRTFKKAGDQAFSVAGRVWNSLPIQIRNSKSTDLFKRQPKTYLYPL